MVLEAAEQRENSGPPLVRVKKSEYGWVQGLEGGL